MPCPQSWYFEKGESTRVQEKCFLLLPPYPISEITHGSQIFSEQHNDLPGADNFLTIYHVLKMLPHSSSYDIIIIVSTKPGR